MDNTEQLLSQLRDIHLPTAINAWPWTPLRYVSLAIILILLIIAGFLFWRHREQRKRQKKFLNQLQALQADNNFSEISTLLKRVAIHYYSKEKVASLQDEEWLAFLDRTNAKNSEPKFQSEIGRLLLTLPYQQNIVIPARSPRRGKAGIQEMNIASLQNSKETQTKKLVAIIQQWILKNIH
jgi:preprotein translocase subunit YajC